MMKKVILAMLIPFLFVGIAGCAPLFLMTVGGVGVYAISKDTIQGDTDTQYETLWDAAMKVARIRGTILQEDFNRGYIQIDAKPNNIKIQFVRITAATTKLRVSARKYKKVLPNIEIAQDVFIKIIEESKRGS
jgi:hypothetical protein